MIAFFLRRRVLTNLMTIFLIVIGGWNFFHVRKEAFPDIKFDIITISTVYPGASPEEVERLVTLPVEETIKTVNNVDHVESYSIEGNSMVVITLEEGLSAAAVSRAVSDVQQAVNRVEDLPDETKPPLVTELTSDRPLLNISVAGGTDWDRDAFAELMKDILEDIPNVSKVEQEGDRAKEIWVEADPERLARYRLTVAEVADRLDESNINLSAGSVTMGGEELLVRSMGAFYTADEVGNVVLRGNDERNVLRVKDIAKVRETFADEKVLARAGGEPAINLLVKKTKRGDAIKLARRVKAFMKEMEPQAAQKGLKLVLSDDTSFFIERRLRIMTNNMLQGGVLIIIALFLFLDWRLALVAALGVPISFGTAMAVAVPFGFTINLLSLLGFIIVLGMLDDDSVVVAENIYRHLEMGKKPFQAAVDGTKEVVLPVLGSVAATASAFIPFALVEGIMGKFLFMIPVIVILCFVASIFEAFFVLPAHVLDILPFGKPVGEKTEGHWYAKVQRLYRRSLGWCVDHRYGFLVIAIGFLAVTAVAASLRLKIVMFPEGLIDQFFVQIEMPRGAALAQTQTKLEAFEDIILALPKEDLDTVTSTVGQMGIEENLRRGTHFGQARVYLQPQENRERSTDEIIAELRKGFDAISGVKIYTIEKLKPGPPVGKAIQIRVRGDDTAVLKSIADQTKAYMATLKGIADIQDNFEGGKTEIRIGINPIEAAFAGVTSAQVARHVLFAFEGGEATKIRRPTEEVIVKVKLDENHRNNPSSVRDLLVLNDQRQQARMAPLVKVERGEGPPFIQRYNYKRTIMVTGSVDNIISPPSKPITKFRNL